MFRLRTVFDWFMYFATMLLVAAVVVGIVYALRDHGVSSCEERGGTPVVASWLSESNWDVRCIHD